MWPWTFGHLSVWWCNNRGNFKMCLLCGWKKKQKKQPEPLCSWHWRAYSHTSYRTSTVCDRNSHRPLKPLIPLKGESPYSITVNRLQLIQLMDIPKVYVSERKNMLIDQLRNFINVVLSSQLDRSSFAQKQMLPLHKSLKRLFSRIISVSVYFCTHLWRKKEEIPKTDLENVNGGKCWCSLVETCRNDTV